MSYELYQHKELGREGASMGWSSEKALWILTQGSNLYLLPCRQILYV